MQLFSCTHFKTLYYLIGQVFFYHYSLPKQSKTTLTIRIRTFVSPPKFICEILMSTVMALGGTWVMKVESSKSGLVPSWKRPHRAPWPLPPCEDEPRSQQSAAQKRALLRAQPCGHPKSWTSSFQILWETDPCCRRSFLVCGFLSWWPEWTKHLEACKNKQAKIQKQKKPSS